MSHATQAANTTAKHNAAAELGASNAARLAATHVHNTTAASGGSATGDRRPGEKPAAPASPAATQNRRPRCQQLGELISDPHARAAAERGVERPDIETSAQAMFEAITSPEHRTDTRTPADVRAEFHHLER
jgi:hypothetical protein